MFATADMQGKPRWDDGVSRGWERLVLDQSNVIHQLFFGRDDAEHDLTDGLLRVGFLVTQAFEEASSGRKSLIIGRKGSGKSAICVRLTVSEVHGGRTCLITPDDAAGDEIRRFELQGLTGETAKSLIWRYVFATHAARYLVRHACDAHGRRLPPSIRALRKFLRNNGEAADTRLYDRVARGGRGLQTSLSLEAFGIKASMETKGGTEGARASKQLEVLETGVARAFADLACAGRHGPLLLLVDQLEQVWSNDPDSEMLVIGLLLAGKYAAKAYGGALRCVFFVRADIYDALDFGDADKFHSDEMRIDWTPDTLREMVLLRARASLGRPLSPDELWERIFPGQVGGEPAADYFLARTLPRPRDVIQFLNLCRDTAFEQGHDTIAESDVRTATLRFSQWKLLDLAREYRVGLPFLDRLFVVFQNTGYVVMRSAIQTRLEPFWGTLREQFPHYADGLNAGSVVDILYGVGFLGVRRGKEVAYAGGAHVPIQPNEVEFHIHPCFRPALNATDPTQLNKYVGPSPQVLNIMYGSVTGAGPGSPSAIRPQRAHRILESLLLSCNRILRQLGRSALPLGARQQISEQIGLVISEAIRNRGRLTEDGRFDPVPYVVQAIDYLDALATQLIRDGIGDGNATGSIAYRIRDEARNLLDEIGGGSGRPGGHF